MKDLFDKNNSRAAKDLNESHASDLPENHHSKIHKSSSSFSFSQPETSDTLKKPFEIQKQSFLPGFEQGRYEPKRIADTRPEKGLLSSRGYDDFAKRDSRVSLRVSSQDLQSIQREAMRQGIPSQSLLANIIHSYVTNLNNGVVVPGFEPEQECVNPEAEMRPDFTRGVSLNEVFIEAVRKEHIRQLKKEKPGL